MNKAKESDKKDIHMQLIPIEERKNAVCAKCGTRLSVKYKLSDSSPERYCNKCIVEVI